MNQKINELINLKKKKTTSQVATHTKVVSLTEL